MKDYFTLTFISGFFAGIIKDLLDAFSYYVLRFNSYLYLHFASEILYGKKPHFWWDTLLAQMTELMFCGMVAIPFAYILRKIKTDNLLFKGFIYGNSVWLLLYTLGNIFKLKYLTHTPWQTTTSDMITSAIYGIVLAIVLVKLADKKDLTINEN